MWNLFKQIKKPQTVEYQPSGTFMHLWGKKIPAVALRAMAGEVELAGLEPASGQSVATPSTCLFTA